MTTSHSWQVLCVVTGAATKQGIRQGGGSPFKEPIETMPYTLNNIGSQDHQCLSCGTVNPPSPPAQRRRNTANCTRSSQKPGPKDKPQDCHVHNQLNFLPMPLKLPSERGTCTTTASSYAPSTDRHTRILGPNFPSIDLIYGVYNRTRYSQGGHGLEIMTYWDDFGEKEYLVARPSFSNLQNPDDSGRIGVLNYFLNKEAPP